MLYMNAAITDSPEISTTLMTAISTRRRHDLVVVNKLEDVDLLAPW